MSIHKSDNSRWSVISLVLVMGAGIGHGFDALALDSALCNCPDGSVGSASQATGGVSRSGLVTDNAPPLSSPATLKGNQQAGIGASSDSSPGRCACPPSSETSVGNAPESANVPESTRSGKGGSRGATTGSR